MSLRAASPQDAPAIEAFLKGHAETSMFLRSNLRAFGPCGGANAVATTMWLQGDPIAGVVGISTGGFVTVQMPGGVPMDVRGVMAGSEVRGITGPPGQVTEVALALGVADRAEAEARGVEPLYRLSLTDLKVPKGPGVLRQAREADVDLLAPWRRAYREETDGFAATLESARVDIARWIADGRAHVLWDGETPLCMTGTNASLPDMVQIGGVFTPPERRNRGLARRALALYLAHARDRGVETAILFAAGPAACRCYEGLGFTLIGAYQLFLLPEPRVVSP